MSVAVPPCQPAYWPVSMNFATLVVIQIHLDAISPNFDTNIWISFQKSKYSSIFFYV